MSYKVLKFGSMQANSNYKGYHIIIRVYYSYQLIFARAFSFYYGDEDCFINSKKYKPY